MTRLRRAARVLAEAPVEMLGIGGVALPLSLVATPLLIGVPPVVWCLGQLTRSAAKAGRSVRGEKDVTPPSAVWRPGIFASLGLAGVTGGGVLVGGVVQHLLGSDGVAVAVAAACGSSVLVGAALAPLAFAPFLAADGARGIVGPLSRSFELASRMGPKRVAALGAITGGLLAASMVLVATVFWGFSPSVEDPAAIFGAPVGLVPGTILSAALLADAYGDLRVAPRDQPARGATELRAARRLWAFAGLLLPTVGGLFIAALVAAFTPTPMRTLEESAVRGAAPFEMTASPTVRRLPGTSVRVRTAERGVLIEADDGGGAGDVAAGFETRQSTLEVRPGPEFGGPPRSFAVLVVTDEARAVMVVDRDGVRLDDGLGRRVLGRLGRMGLGALLSGIVLPLLALFRLGSELGRARVLEAPTLQGPSAGPSNSVKALSGTLRAPAGAVLRRRPAAPFLRLLGLRGPTLSVDGEWWVEADGGTWRFRLRSKVPVLGDVKAAVPDGDVVLLSRFTDASPTGWRDAYCDWPSDGRLVLGTREDAARELARRATRRATLLAAPALVALVAAAGILLANL